ncbi:MAG TPA: STELLO glycosyltransferase family protein [Pyrinomonadaceae bacterium]|nr:STELLO glycosyltransferase family protein [Pyrinomonadaceae bacterium]
MKDKVAVVVTSINEPTPALQKLAAGCSKHGYELIVVGDEGSPEFKLDGCRYYGLNEQRELGFRLGELCPTNHYVRKNIGYLQAIRGGATIILETDDDNIPYEDFWTARERRQYVRALTEAGWVNIYSYFSDVNVWPRGLPLEHVGGPMPGFEVLNRQLVDCPIQQALSDSDPDVDAIYRLTLPLPLSFNRTRRIALTTGTWSPFNSQNTAWWADAFLLLYLPSCSFRMTDIWRSFIAQRIAWTNNWGILFQGPTGEQHRNEHNLMSDFEDELPGYLHNGAIGKILDSVSLRTGLEHISDNLRVCYDSLVKAEMLDAGELVLLDAWIEGVAAARGAAVPTRSRAQANQP